MDKVTISQRTNNLWWFVLLAIAMSSCGTPDSASPTGISDGLRANSAPSYPQQANNIPQNQGEVPRISVHELRQQLDSGSDVILIDTRTRSFYDSGHIPGSIQIIGPKIAEHLEELPRDVDIVLYCT